MGWFPIRQADNTVLDKDLYFPREVSDKGANEKIIRIRRGGAVRTGNGVRRKETDAKRLVASAMARGFLNGKPLKRKGQSNG